MQYLILGLVLAVLAIAAAACRPAEKPPPSGAAASAAVTAEPVPGSRADIAARLAALARDPAPTDLSQGAMCYDSVGPPVRAEYVCPVCGEKTLYASVEDPARRVSRGGMDAADCRRLVTQIRDLTVRLDESELCEKCRPGIASPRLALVVTYPDGREHRTEGVDATDLALLVEFTAGARKHDAGQGGETALKDHLARLEALLGVSPAGR